MVPDLISGRVNSTYTMSVPWVTIEGPYVLKASVSASGRNESNNSYYPIKADSTLTAGAEGVFVRLEVYGEALSSGKMSVSALDLDLGFKILSFDPKGLMIGGQLIDLSHLAGLVELLFEKIWTPQNKPRTNEMIRCALNYTIHVCKHLQLSCVQFCITFVDCKILN
jgi:hypothetical protein